MSSLLPMAFSKCFTPPGWAESAFPSKSHPAPTLSSFSTSNLTHSSMAFWAGILGWEIFFPLTKATSPGSSGLGLFL